METRVNADGIAVPSMGRIVQVRFKDRRYNSTEWAPAIVVNQFGASAYLYVNARVFVDGEENPPLVRSCSHESAPGAAEAPYIWRWPPRE